MKILLYIFGFWGGWIVGMIVGMALFGASADSPLMLFGLIGSGVGIWCVRKTQNKDPQPQTESVSPQPQTTYTDNRTIDNRKVYHIVAGDKEEATQIIHELENREKTEALNIDEVRRKLLEKK